ncbi:MAG: hypothetical protein ACXVJT_14625 [Thermoanaerobaculia bacterium]
MRKAIPYLIAAFAFAPQAALAQKPSADAARLLASEPGKATLVTVAEISATVVAINKATRTVTLQEPQGRSMNVVADDTVKNFDQIQVGDSVAVRYQEALSLELKKTNVPANVTGAVGATRAQPGERPGGAIAREVTVVADVVAVDPKNSLISLKGPNGNIVDLKVLNQDHFKVVKVGDQVEAVYSEALAIAVTPAAEAGSR